ncbi:MAG TPA: transglutaminase family protein [Tepidisphaeraceae bacterium]|nr:transglutaminase family protein [Tepidisphaeraceae bacterium]
MLIKTGYELVFDLPAPAAMLLMLYVHPQRAKDLVQPEKIRLEPDLPIHDFIDGFGNRAGRIFAPAGRLRIYNDILVNDSGLHDEVINGAIQHPIDELPPETLQFLLGSRYCEVDRLSDIAWNMFGNTPLGWQRVQAVMDWCHNNVTFGYEFARATRTAYEVYEERHGVCRDFMHLAVTFLRCMNIPARYATGYLGDIGVPVVPLPMDFSAWFEVYLSHRWYTLDARHNEPRIGRILMGRGRDATDVALTTSFGPAKLEKFEVWTDEVQQPTSAT